MVIETFVVEARTHGRYRVRPPVEEPRGIVVGFHGYLQDAGDFLADFGVVPGADSWALVAVDALHAFYPRGSGNGRVVRGWMTRDLREEAIADNVAYVRDVLDQCRRRFGWRLPVVAVGFSQGASMAWRAALLAGHEIAAVAALGGDIPPELARLPASSPFPRRALIARGESDEWYSEARLAADRELLAGRALELRTPTLAGGHEWTDAFRSELGALLAAAAG